MSSTTPAPVRQVSKVLCDAPHLFLRWEAFSCECLWRFASMGNFVSSTRSFPTLCVKIFGAIIYLANPPRRKVGQEKLHLHCVVTEAKTYNPSLRETPIRRNKSNTYIAALCCIAVGKRAVGRGFCRPQNGLRPRENRAPLSPPGGRRRGPKLLNSSFYRPVSSFARNFGSFPPQRKIYALRKLRCDFKFFRWSSIFVLKTRDFCIRITGKLFKRYEITKTSNSNENSVSERCAMQSLFIRIVRK